MSTPASVHQAEALLFFTLLQLAIIILAVRAGGALALRLGQSGAVSEIIAGIQLGPSLFGVPVPERFGEWAPECYPRRALLHTVV